MKTPSWTEKLLQGSDILIIHHWDADGNSSAAMITKYLSLMGDFNIKYASPDPGTFRLQFRPDNGHGNIDMPSGDFISVFILDYSVPADDIKSMYEKMQIPVIVYDHHLRSPVDYPGIYYYNPVAMGDDGSNWPSCTWVIRKYLDQEISDLAILGIAGDYEERFLKNGLVIFPEIADYLKTNEIEYMDYVRAKDLIDIHYKENDRETLSVLPAELLRLEGSPGRILSMSDWEEKQQNHIAELNSIINRSADIQIRDEIEVYHVDTHKNIISTMARQLAAKTSFRYVMVINRGLFAEDTQIYVRAAYDQKDPDTKVFKDTAKTLGAQVGGKKEVAGIIISDERVDEFISRINKEYG
jgi:single-stranded DNA-specific DHH superfamily exonuclease